MAFRQLCGDWICNATRCVLIAICLLGCSRTPPPDRNASTNPPTRSERLRNPELRPIDYVGSETCAECHRDIAETYFQHPMGRASGSIHVASKIEQYGPATAFVVSDGRRYLATEKEGQIWHHEQLLDDSGEPIHEQSVQIELSIGSGRRGRSYGYRRANRFFQSPLSWYSSKNAWDLSPGFRAEGHQRFDRVLTERCLDCHVGRINAKSAPDVLDAEKPILEHVIGCERCHGPGASHVEHHRNPQNSSIVDSIVEPSKLDHFRRDAVCHQCHLQAKKTIPRFGRRSFDFRPGDRLSDIWVAFRGSRSNQQAVTQAEQMLASTCYRASQGKLGCISCHDAHSVPQGNPVPVFERRCLACHGPRQTECSASMADRGGKSCLDCHMPRFDSNIPHTALTDHRILRRPTESRPSNESDANLEVIEDGEPRLPDWEIRRAQALALRQDPALTQTEFDLQLGIRRLRGLKDQLPDDAELWEGLAWLNSRSSQWSDVEANSRRALALDSDRLDSREMLVDALIQRQAWDEVLSEIDELLKRDPHGAMYYAIQADLAWRGGRVKQGLQAGERSLELNPTQQQLRQRVIESYRRTGNTDAADRHQRILDRRASSVR